MGMGIGIRKRNTILEHEKPIVYIGLSENEVKLLLAGLQALTASASVTSHVTKAEVAMNVFRPTMALVEKLRFERELALKKKNEK